MTFTSKLFFADSFDGTFKTDGILARATIRPNKVLLNQVINP